MFSTVLNNDTTLSRNFQNSVYPMVCFNFGPSVTTFEHQDQKNLPNGWCAVTALGDFDASKGGHLIFRQLGLAVRFPSGSTVLFPSATLLHGNTSIQQGETRSSITQYAAGGLFRWVDYECMICDDLKKKDPVRYRELERTGRQRWTEALKRYSTVESLHSDRMALKRS